MNTLHQYTTTLNGAIVDVFLDVSAPSWIDRLVSVQYEGQDITPVLDKNTLTALSMEAEHAYSGQIHGE